MLILGMALSFFIVVRLRLILRDRVLQEEIGQQHTELKQMYGQLQREVEERQRAQYESQHHKTMHEAVFENSRDAMLLLENGVIIDGNFSLAEEIASILTVMQVKTTEKGLHLRYEGDGLLPERLIGDSTRLIQVLTNLLNNAIKFTAQGEILLRIDLERREDGLAWLRFRVCSEITWTKLRSNLGQIWVRRLSKTAGVAGLRRGFCD